jgi:hypothetical protein
VRWLTCMLACCPSVLGDAIHFVLCGLRNCKFGDIACQNMQLSGSNNLTPAQAVTVTLTLELSPATGGQSPCSVSFSRTCKLASSKSTVTLRDADGGLQQLSEVGEYQ